MARISLVATGVAVVMASGLFIWSLTQDKGSTAAVTTVAPELAFDETPDPETAAGLPMLGASGCTSPFLASTSRLSNDVLTLMNSEARAYVTPPNGRWTWSDAKGRVYSFQQGLTRLTPAGQVVAFKAAVLLLANPERSTLSITTRKILRQMMPNCNWDADLQPGFGLSSLSKDEYNLFVSVWYLVQAAARQVRYQVGGPTPWKHLMIPWGGGPGLLIGRGFLGLADVAAPGGLALEPGRRVELIGGEYSQAEWPRPPFFHAEPLYARVVEMSAGRPTVEILATFGDKNVSPKFAHRHGFRAGRRLKLPGTGTTAVRKVFAPGVE